MRASQAHAPSVHDPERPGISRGTYYDVPRDSGLDRMRIYDDEQTAAQWEAAIENERRSNGLCLFTVLPRYRAQMHGIIPEHMLRPPRNATMQEIARAAERVVQAEEAWLEQEQEARDDRERNEAKKAARKRKKKRQFVDGGMWPMDDAASDEGASAAAEEPAAEAEPLAAAAPDARALGGDEASLALPTEANNEPAAAPAPADLPPTAADGGGDGGTGGGGAPSGLERPTSVGAPPEEPDAAEPAPPPAADVDAEPAAASRVRVSVSYEPLPPPPPTATATTIADGEESVDPPPAAALEPEAEPEPAFPNARHSPVCNSAYERNALCDLRRAVHTGATARETHAAADQPYDSDATEVLPSDDEYACAIFADAQKANDERRARSRYWASQSFSITRIKLIQIYSAQARADELRVTPEQKADLVLAKYGQTKAETKVLMEAIEARYGDKDGAEPPAKRHRGDSDAPHPMTIPTVPRTPMPSARCVVS